jgi:hypothetical protein
MADRVLLLAEEPEALIGGVVDAGDEKALGAVGPEPAVLAGVDEQHHAGLRLALAGGMGLGGASLPRGGTAHGAADAAQRGDADADAVLLGEQLLRLVVVGPLERLPDDRLDPRAERIVERVAGSTASVAVHDRRGALPPVAREQSSRLPHRQPEQLRSLLASLPPPVQPVQNDKPLLVPHAQRHLSHGVTESQNRSGVT